MKYNGEYNDIEVFLHFEPDKGMAEISMGDGISFLFSVLNQS